MTQGMLTLDVEDWDHANYAVLDARKSDVQRSVRSKMYAMDRNIDRWIEVLDRQGVKSTCFVLGEFAQRFPTAVIKLAQAGHEIASHSYTHDLIYQMTREQFRENLTRALGVVGDLVGKKPVGFRAPSWSVDSRVPWFCEELERQGIEYDSSEFPIWTPLFGERGAPLMPYRVGKLVRIPVTVALVLGARLPFASGAFFRLSPLSFIRFGLNQARKAGRPCMIVLHPRELDPEHPRLPIGGISERIHYARLSTTLPKLEAVLTEGKWGTIASALASFQC